MIENTAHGPLIRKQLTRRQYLKFSAWTTLSTTLVAAGCSREQNTDAETGGTIATVANTEEASTDATSVSTSISREDVLRIAFSNVSLSFDPATTLTNSAIQAILLLFDGLVRVDTNLEIQPALAERWEVTDDLLQWTFTLRQNVQFHHGQPFTAQDVVYTFKRLLDPAVGSPIRNVLGIITAVTTIDDGSATGAVRFTLNQAYADFLVLCGAPQASILDHNYATELLSRSPSGTGPYLVDELIPGQYTQFLRNGNYWDVESIAIQAIDHLYLPIFKERITALASGEVDMLADISSTEALSIEESAGARIVEVASGSYQTIVMQATESPFDDLRVRQALKLSIDRAMIQERLLNGRGEIGADHPIASSNPYYAGLETNPYNPEQAKQLLADAGYPNGVQLDLVTASVDPGMVELAYLLQESAEPAGFDITPTEVPADVYWDSYWMQVPFHIGSWNFRPSIDETFTLPYHSSSPWNESRWSNLEFDTLVESARIEADLEQRKALYAHAQELLMVDGAVIVPFFRPLLTALNDRVSTFKPHPGGWIDPRELALVKPSTAS